MKNLRDLFARHTDVAVVLAVVGVLLVLFVPIPRPLLDFLILANFSFALLVLLLTFYYARRLHNDIPFEEYLQSAHVGMLEALSRFDPARGVLFRTFAARRMHGSILDGLERFSEKQQQIAVRQRLRSERLAGVTALAGEACGRAEPPSDPQQLLRYVAEVGIGLALCWLLEGTGMVEDAGSFHSAPFYRSAALREMRQALLDAVEALPPQERTVVRGHYLQEQPFEQIAVAMHLTKGRISQIHKQALLHLRASVRQAGEWSLRL